MTQMLDFIKDQPAGFVCREQPADERQPIYGTTASKARRLESFQECSGPESPGIAQRDLYRTAYEQVQHNIGILEPGLTFREYSERAWDIPGRHVANRYYLSAHGCGMTGEYPYLYHRMDYAAAGYHRVIEPGMTLCVESYIGEEGGPEGVKLEQQCLITPIGVEVLSQYPFEASLK